MHKTRNGSKRSAVFTTKGKNIAVKRSRSAIESKSPTKVAKKVKVASAPVVNVLPPPNFPLVGAADLDEAVPIYSSFLTQDGITMDDLTPLQADLEKMLSTCELRKRLLLEKIETLKQFQRTKKNKRNKICLFDMNKQQQLTVKPKKVEMKGKGKRRNLKNGIRPTRNHNTLPADSLVNTPSKSSDVPKVALAKNDSSDKFWLSTEPFCAEISHDDVAFLDDLIQESSEKDEIVVPPIDKHYAKKWNCEMLAQQKNLTGSQKLKTKNNTTVGNKVESFDFNKMVNTFTSPLSHRLFESLVDVNIRIDASNETTTKRIPPKLKKRSCMYKRLQKDLMAEGLLKMEDIAAEQNDEILREIDRCVQELKVVKEHNVTELTKLRTAASRNIKRQKLKASLDEVDKKVLEMYNKILANKRNPLIMHDPNNIIKSYEEEANELIKKQVQLQNTLLQFDDEVDDEAQ